MKVCETVGYVGATPIWKYERKEGDYLVREELDENGAKLCYIKAPSEKLYCFDSYHMIEKLITLIESGEAEKPQYATSKNSIFDD